MIEIISSGPGRSSNAAVSRIRSAIRPKAQYILAAIATLATEDERPARSKEIQTVYETVADANGASPLTTLKSVQDHLSDLHMLGFLIRHEQNQGRSGGQYYEYELDLDPNIIVQTRKRIAEQTR